MPTTIDTPPHPLRSHRHQLRRWISLPSTALLLAVSPLTQLRADTAAGATDEVVKLPEFTISSERETSYTGTSSLSTTRSGVPLSDLAQSVTVLNRAFFNDFKPSILAHSLNYVGGTQTGTINWSVDRFIIRGFVGEGDYVDGFRTMTDRNTDMNLVDHVEIIKGPAAIFISNAVNSAGGVVNKVSKSPTDYNVGTLTAQWGIWDANRADLDVGGPITADKKLMYRLLINRQQAKGYSDHTYDNRTSIVPMLAYKFNNNTQVWIKYENFDSHYSSYNGIPLDGSGYVPGQANAPHILAVPRRWNIDGEDSPRNWRTDYFYRLWGQFTTRPADWIAMRLAAFDSADTQRRVESIIGTTNITANLAGGGTTTLPTGYQIPPGYTRGTLLNRTTTAVDGDYQPRRELQNDYVFTFDTWDVNHKLLVGWDAYDSPDDTKTYSSGGTSTASSSAIDPFNPPYKSGAADTVTVNTKQLPTSNRHIRQNFSKAYVLETASFLNDTVILDWGANRSRYKSSLTNDTYNQKTGVFTPAASGTSNLIPNSVAYKNLVQYGVVFKPLPNVSLFFDDNRNFAFTGFGATGPLPPNVGHQKEIGIKSTWLDSRLSFNVTYFDATSANNTVPAFPQLTPPVFLTLGTETSRGIDGDWTFAVTKNLYLLGSFAWFNANIGLTGVGISAAAGSPTWNQVIQPYDGKAHGSLPVDNVSQRNASLWARYSFTEGALKGLTFGLGANYLDKRAITDNTNNVFFGYIPARTLVDGVISYATKHFIYQINGENLLDTRYIYSARSQLVIIPGEPLNVSASVTYKFL
ncbi:MAG TPA: TonB-dependent receptor plug domain-containing protein [Opitutaceae bacterium]|jgi:iron complex outermembrane receptor protein|nr:TonB-dependent receptor plug domain-containing protein [Opitutaceae bacterium]